MAPETFPLFSSLPLELRRKIYMLATPPRIVHVQEETEDEEEFEERFQTTPVQIKLDPCLAHFAFNWRHHISRYCEQRTLESFGFTSTKAPYQPWEPSSTVPKIPLQWLGIRPRVAWELLRWGYLYSNAPIPALLHTCVESRTELKSRGYELAFRTRTCEARTWFNYERDVLFIGGDAYAYDEGQRGVLSGGPWDLGQFYPDDLKKVRKVALKGTAYTLSTVNLTAEVAIESSRYSINQLSSVLRLLSGITELLLVDWYNSIEEWSGFEDWNTRRFTPDDLPELWKCVAVEEIDALFLLLGGREKYRSEACSTGERAGRLKTHKQEYGASDPYFPRHQQEIEKVLLEQRDTTLKNAPADAIIQPWTIPKVKAVHILTESMASFLVHERRVFWDEFCAMKRAKQKEKEEEEVEEILPSAPNGESSKQATATATVRPRSPLPFNEEEEEAFADAHYNWENFYCCEQCCYDSGYTEQEKAWWIEEGWILEPENEVLY